MRATRLAPSTAKRPAAGKWDSPEWLVDSLRAAWTGCRAMAVVPFDALRAGRASAVKAGLLPNSMLAARDFEHVLGALERVTLGPLARRV